MKYTRGCSEQINRIQAALESADAVLIGAGAGLSSSAGFAYGGERFLKYFADFHAKYGIADMYSGGFYPFGTVEEYWAWWSRHIFYNRYVAPPKPVYDELHALVKGKDYFVLTTNVDHCFQKAGFDKKRLFYTQGDYGLFQCSAPCREKTYGNEALVRRMVAEQTDMKIPSELVPRCPVCGKPMTVNVRVDDTFVQDDGWNAACRRYGQFIAARATCRMLYMELGVGSNTPGIIKYPFWRMAAENKRSAYVCINSGEAFCPDELKARAICLDADIGAVLSAVRRVRSGRLPRRFL